MQPDPPPLATLPTILIPLLIALFVAIVGLSIHRSGLGSLLGAGKQGWHDALKAVAEALGLAFDPLPQAYARARGEVSGMTLEIGYGSMDDYDGLVMEIELFVGALSESVAILPSGTRPPRDVEVGPIASTGDAAFDAAVELRGVSRAFLSSLAAHPAARDALRDAVATHGLALFDRHVRVQRRRFAASEVELRPLVEAVLALGRIARSPGDAVAAGAAPGRFGTPAAAALRLADDLEDAPKAAALRRFFESLAPRLPDLRVYGPEDEVDLDVRALVRGRPLRIEVDWTLGVEITAKANSTQHRPSLEFDPDRSASAGQAPAWDESGGGQREFLTDRIYVEGDKRTRREDRAAFESLPKAVQVRITREVPTLCVRYLRVRDGDVWAMLWGQLNEYDDPEAHMLSAVDLVVAVADAFGPYAERAAPDEDEALGEDEDQRDDEDDEDEDDDGLDRSR